MPLEAAALYERPFAYVERHVKPEREKSRTTRAERWLHERPRPEMRDALAPLRRYIATPTTARYRLFVWEPAGTVPHNALIVFARQDDYTFGVVHSRAHELWSLRMGTSLEDRPRYTPITTFETFPFPRPTAEQRDAIAEAARDLDVKRNAWLNPPDAPEIELRKRTLTNLYNERPAWLRLAHERLDAAVLAAYGWPLTIADDDLLERLLALNFTREPGGAVPAGVLAGSGDDDEEMGAK